MRVFIRHFAVLTILLLTGVVALAQDLPVHDRPVTFVGIIEDPDSYTNVRDRPSLEGRVVDKLLQGEHFFVRSGWDWEWWEVCTPRGKWGYTHRSRLKQVRSGAYYPVRVTDPDGTVNLRSGPGTEHPVILRSPTDTCLVVLLKQANPHVDVRSVLTSQRWFEVMTPEGKVGFVHGSRITPVID